MSLAFAVLMTGNFEASCHEEIQSKHHTVYYDWYITATHIDALSLNTFQVLLLYQMKSIIGSSSYSPTHISDRATVRS
jgi:hypothetical protein